MILDNHSSHCSLQAVELCRKEGVVLLTLPPHCSHRLQPLDRSINGPLKTYFKTALVDWNISNPGRSVSIYEMGHLGGLTFTKSMSATNILSGFSSTGIFPQNRNIFEEHEFLPSDVTDRPSLPATVSDVAETLAPKPAPVQACVSQPSTSHLSPSDIIPLPKAGMRTNTVQKRKTCKSTILTDTPE